MYRLFILLAQHPELSRTLPNIPCSVLAAALLLEDDEIVSPQMLKAA
jgi:hypothetical protein